MKRFILLLVCILSLLTPLNVEAHNQPSPVYSGYTEEGIYYEVYVNTDIANFTTYTTRVPYSIYLSFYGYVYPNPTIYYAETLNGIKYVGTLELQNYYHADGITTAYYEGTLYAIS